MLPSAPDDAHMAHAPAGLRADALADHLVVGEERAVEEDERHAGEPLARRRRISRRSSRHRRSASRRCGSPARASSPSASNISVSRTALFQIERHLARDRERPHLDAAFAAVRTVEAAATHRVSSARRGTIVRFTHLEDRILVENRQHGGCGVERERRALAQMQQAGDRIHVAVGQHHAGDRARARAPRSAAGIRWLRSAAADPARR